MDGGKKKKRNWGNLVGEKNCPRFSPGEKKEGSRKKRGRSSCHARSATKGIVTFVVDTKRRTFL